MNIEKMEKKWVEYEEEFDNSDEMDIEKHINMALNVGGLISEVKRLRRIVEDSMLPLNPCDDCGKSERNPGLEVCGECYDKRING